MSTQQTDLPDFVPDEYDPEADLYERLPVIAEMEGGIQLHAADGTGTDHVLGSPHDLNEDCHENYRLHVGGRQFNWDYEIVVPSGDHPPRVEEADPDQDIEDYYDSRDTWLEPADVRIYGVDLDHFAHRDTNHD